MNKRLKTITLGITLLLFANVSVLLSVFLILEWALGLGESSAVSESQTRPDPFYSWSFKTSGGATIGREGLLGLAMHPFAVYANLPNQKTAYFTTDQQGFRGPPNPRGLEKSKNTKTIVIVGGSTAFGTGLNRDEDTFGARLQAELGNVNVINAAVIGHLSGQELSYIVSDLVNLRPNLIIVIDGYNDLMDQITNWPRTATTAAVNNTFFVMEERMQQLYVLETGGLLSRIGAALPRIFKNTTRTFFASSDPVDQSSDPSSWSEIKGPEKAAAGGGIIPKHPVPLARVYAFNVRKMQVIAAAFGARFVCALQPDQQSFRSGEKKDWLARAYSVFRAEAKKALSAGGVVHIDLNDVGDFTQDMFLDRMHLNARGNQAMSAVLTRTIRERDLLPRD